MTPDERDATMKELIAWAADPRNAYTGHWTDIYCRWCKQELPADQMFEDADHDPDCLHLRARALRGEDG